MTDLTREEFAVAVHSTISSVHHLYKEVGRLYVALRDALQAEPVPFVAIGGFPAKVSRDGSRTIARSFFGQLFEPSLIDDLSQEDEEMEDDEEEEIDEESTPKKGGKTPVQLSGRLLAVKLKLHDPKREKFEPHLQYAVIGDWTVGPKHDPIRADDWLARYMLRRIIAAFDLDRPDQPTVTRAVVKKSRSRQKAVDRRVSFRVLKSGAPVPLFDLSSLESIDRVAQRIQGIWSGE
ncbi:MAG: hypothetical protein IT430_14355 [Phycisphaerales bacterium]|nr:hypothetical protein [Phycisphaerales bacterium]